MSDHPLITSGKLEAYNFVTTLMVPEQRILTIAAKNEEEATKIFKELTADCKDVKIVQIYNVREVDSLYELMFGQHEHSTQDVKKVN